VDVLTTVAAVREARSAIGGSAGFVPTMGYLHEGHISLVRAARAADDAVFASIFVNPTQFSPHEDFAAYPRDPDRDLAMLQAAGADYVFLPSVEEMYPAGFETSVDVGSVSLPLEGAVRPGHFRGVATVVLKLFSIVQPTHAYFGQKDAQQLVVIKKMVRDLNLPVQVVPMPTVREADGLAMSSRNTYLTSEQRQAAPVLYQALTLAQEMWTRGVRDAEAIRSRMRELIEAEELASIDYISVANPETLMELDRVQGPALVSMAVRFGKTRLIDNVTLGA
jgi:pantoate--beta-alanine ligase